MGFRETGQRCPGLSRRRGICGSSPHPHRARACECRADISHAAADATSEAQARRNVRRGATKARMGRARAHDHGARAAAVNVMQGGGGAVAGRGWRAGGVGAGWAGARGGADLRPEPRAPWRNQRPAAPRAPERPRTPGPAAGGLAESTLTRLTLSARASLYALVSLASQKIVAKLTRMSAATESRRGP